MEDEYRLTLMSLGRDRERLEGVVASLKGYLVDARHDREVRLVEYSSQYEVALSFIRITPGEI